MGQRAFHRKDDNSATVIRIIILNVRSETAAMCCNIVLQQGLGFQEHGGFYRPKELHIPHRG